MAEYLCVPATNVVSAEDLSLDAAAMVEFLAIGAHGVARGGVTGRDRVLVVGSGPIGMAAIVFAKCRGAHVTVVDGRQDRLDFAAAALGADATEALSPDLEAMFADRTERRGVRRGGRRDRQRRGDAARAEFRWARRAVCAAERGAGRFLVPRSRISQARDDAAGQPQRPSRQTSPRWSHRCGPGMCRSRRSPPTVRRWPKRTERNSWNGCVPKLASSRR